MVWCKCLVLICLPCILVKGDKEQVKAWKFLENFMKENKLINKKTYLSNMFKIYLLIHSPSFIRKLAYDLLLRRNKHDNR